MKSKERNVADPFSTENHWPMLARCVKTTSAKGCRHHAAMKCKDKSASQCLTDAICFFDFDFKDFSFFSFFLTFWTSSNAEMRSPTPLRMREGHREVYREPIPYTMQLDFSS